MTRLNCVPLRNAKRLPHEHAKELDQPKPAQLAAMPIKKTPHQKANANKPK
jgi:hypothetical protein